MKTGKQAVILTVMVAIAATTFNSCKKGDGDPGISLNSRKARVAGEWTVTKYESTYQSSYTCTWGSATSSTSSSTDSYDGTTWTSKNSGTDCSNTNWTNNDATKVIWTFTFEKDGTFKEHKEETDSAGNKNVDDMEGTWNFLGGVGDVKNKEQISFTYTKGTIVYTPVSGTGTTYSSTSAGKLSVSGSYFITTLKSKEMIWHSDYDDNDSNTSGGATSTYSYKSTDDFTLTAK